MTDVKLRQATTTNLNSTVAERLIALRRVCRARGIANARGHLDHEARTLPRSPESSHLHRRPRWAVVAKSPLPHLIQGGAITLEVRGEQADANHVTEISSRGAQDRVQIGEKLLGFGLSAVRTLPSLRIDPE